MELQGRVRVGVSVGIGMLEEDQEEFSSFVIPPPHNPSQNCMFLPKAPRGFFGFSREGMFFFNDINTWIATVDELK